MKEFHLWLPNGTEIALKGDRYEDLLDEIDNFFDIFKSSCTYYLGYDDQSVIEQAKEEEINIKEV